MNNENIQSYFTIVLNNINTINSVMELMRSQERTMSHLLGTQQRPIRNVSRSVPVRSTNNAYIPPRSRVVATLRVSLSDVKYSVTTASKPYEKPRGEIFTFGA